MDTQKAGNALQGCRAYDWEKTQIAPLQGQHLPSSSLMFPSQHSRKAAEIKAMEGGFDFASKKEIKVFENKVQLGHL